MSIESAFAICISFSAGIILRTLVMNILSTREQETITKELVAHACFMISLLLIHANSMKNILSKQVSDHMSKQELDALFVEVRNNIISQHKMVESTTISSLSSETLKDFESSGFFELIDCCSDIYDKGPVEYLVNRHAEFRD